MVERYRQKTMKTTGPNPSPLYQESGYQSSPLSPSDLSEPLSVKSNPQPWWLGVTSFIYLYIGDLSHDHYQSFSREVTCVLTVHLPYSFLIFMMHHHLSSWCTITYLTVHSFLSYRSFILSSRRIHYHMLAWRLSQMITWSRTLVYKYVLMFWCIPRLCQSQCSPSWQADH